MVSVSHECVVGIFVAAEARGPMMAVDRVKAVEGRGLDGDRYAAGAGNFSSTKPGPQREVTLIEAEAVEAVRRDNKLDIEPAGVRRNILTRGVALNHLVGREFSVGEVVLRGIKLCEPCSHLARVTGRPEVEKAFLHRGGLNAQIVRGGEISVGDPIRVSVGLGD
jgi:MOSC domain-containing protein YiiM